MNAITLKTKKIGLLLFTGLSILTIQAQQIRNVGDFTGIKVSDAFSIVVSQSEINSVKVDADEKVQPQIKTEVKDGILNISAEGNLKSEKTIVITVGVKSLSSLDASGSTDVNGENQLVCDKLTIESSGAGDVHLDIKANEITTKISGAGDITLKGSAQLLNASVSGAGDLKASNLEAEKAKITVSGAGDAKINVKQSLDADVSGAGSIIYKGNPTDRNVSISGAGSVRESKIGTGEETASDTTKFKLGNKKYMIIGDGDEDKSDRRTAKDTAQEFKHWQGIDLGVNGFLGYDNSLNVPKNADFLELNYGKSIQFGLNLLEKDFHIYKNYINIVTGFGFDFNHYAFQNNITLNPDTSYLVAGKDDVKYKKNTLNVSYIKAPLILEFNTSKNPDKNFHIGVGAEFAYRIHAVTKQKYDANDTHYKNKQRDDYNLEPFRYSAIARVGYNNVTIFANYGLNRLFKKDQGPQVYPFTVGVTISI
ncbi:MAG: hypothetical protein A3F72_18140 [Bacteroidetes bacterium RIFCSPLOWO2_12_FULL_35_15]|nr:MAG: hypothetical protein A3F72_18140 [Bacteroidetes bacterium RIFCSPLOWO2_12_FULL_35_15]